MKKRFTFIDGIITAVVIAAVAAAGVMAASKAGIGAEHKRATFTVLLASQEPGVAEAMTVGDKVTLSYTDKDRGTLTGIETKPAETMTFDSINGEYRMEPVEGKEDVYATVEADVNVTDEYIKTGETLIRVGSEMPVRGKGYVAKGFVITLDVE